MRDFDSIHESLRDPSGRGRGWRELLVWIVLCCVCLGGARTCATPLPAQPNPPADGKWSVLIQKADGSQPVFAHQADLSLAPASVLKLFTTAYVLDRLGTQARQRTELRAEALEQGTVVGPLYFVGGGDPNLSSRPFPYTAESERDKDPLIVLRALAMQLWQAGVRRIPDGIVAVDGPFPADSHPPPGWTDEDRRFWYGAPIHGLYVNDASILVRIRPAKRPGALAEAEIRPNPEGFIRNAVRTVGKRQKTEAVRLVAGRSGWQLAGSVRVGSGTFLAGLAQPDPPRFAAVALRTALREQGIAVSDRIRVQALSASADVGQGGTIARNRGHSLANANLVLAEHWSPSLAEEVQVINKVSQNTHIETLLRLADLAQGRDGSRDSAVSGLEQWALERGLIDAQARMVDGSGLSREDRLSAHDLVRLLNWAQRQTWWSAYSDSLPRAGDDGTLRRRFQNLDTGIVLAKTGTLAEALSLAGILYTQPGHAYVFAILANDFSMSRLAVRRIMDQFLRGWIQTLALETQDPAKKSNPSAAGSGS